MAGFCSETTAEVVTDIAGALRCEANDSGGAGVGSAAGAGVTIVDRTGTSESGGRTAVVEMAFDGVFEGVAAML